MVLSLLIGCNNGVAELEKRNKFYESVMKIGQGFQEIFGIFGNAMGEALGFNAVKADDTRDKVGKYFEKIGEGLKTTKDKLDGLAREISSAPHADTTGVESIINTSSELIAKLIDSVTKLAVATKKDSTNKIGESVTAKAEIASKEDVDIIIAEVKAIVETADKSGVKINKGNAGKAVEKGNTDAPAALNAHSSAAGAGATTKLADKVLESDPWAMIDKIKDATTSGLVAANANNAGQLATCTPTDNTGAKAATTADLAAAVALKAMTKGGKFSHNASEDGAVQSAATGAVNKVLGILEEIIRRTVEKNLDKVREAVKKIQYSDNTEIEATAAKK